MTDSTSIEYGCARQDELDSVLCVLCEAFEMNYSRARTIFYSDPLLNSNNILVARCEGRIVACLSITDTICLIDGHEAPAAGISGVATLEAYRGRGYMSGLLTYLPTVLEERGYAMALLVPSRRTLYKRLGWADVSHSAQCFLTRDSLLQYAHTMKVEGAAIEDLPAIAELCREQCTHTLAIRRSLQTWQTLYSRMHQIVVARDEKSRIRGYMLLFPRRGSAGIEGEEKAPFLQVAELITNGSTARYALQSYLASQEISKIELSGPIAFFLGCEPNEINNSEVHIRDGCMGRMVSFVMLLNIVLKHRSLDMPLMLSVTATDQRSIAQRVMLTIDERGIIRADITDLTSFNEEVVGDMAAWTQTLLGYQSAKMSLATGSLKATNESAARLAIKLFPALAPYLSDADSF